MKQLTTSSLKQGYITIPRALLNRQATDGAAGETEAFLQILAHTPIIPTCHTTSTGQSFYANAVTPLSAITTGAIFSAGHAPKPPVSFNDWPKEAL